MCTADSAHDEFVGFEKFLERHISSLFADRRPCSLSPTGLSTLYVATYMSDPHICKPLIFFHWVANQHRQHANHAEKKPPHSAAISTEGLLQ